nr:hypothetical protein CFP56_66264 [Quercus suber]
MQRVGGESMMECEGSEGEFIWVIGDGGLINDGWDIDDGEWGYLGLSVTVSGVIWAYQRRLGYRRRRWGYRRRF